MKTAATRTLASLSFMTAVVTGCAAPRLTAPENTDQFYAQASVRLEQEGSVVLHFSVGPDGRVPEPITHDEPVVTVKSGGTPDSNAGLRLIIGAERYLRAAKFETRGIAKRQLTASFVFEVKPCGKLAHSGAHDYAINLCRESAPRPWVNTP